MPSGKGGGSGMEVEKIAERTCPISCVWVENKLMYTGEPEGQPSFNHKGREPEVVGG